MIRNDTEYWEARARLDGFLGQIEGTRRELKEQGANAETVQLAVDPLECLVAEVEFELSLYEQLRAEGVSAVPSYPAEERGKALIALRIARGFTQGALARAIGVEEAALARKERNDYQGISEAQRARILEALRGEPPSGGTP